MEYRDRDFTNTVVMPDSPPRPRFLRQFVRMVATYWPVEKKGRAAGLVVLLVALTVCQIVLQVRINTWSADLFDALEQHSTKQFLVQIGVLAAILGAGMVITASHLTIKRQIQLDWRRRLTRRMLGDWMEDGHQFLVTHMPGEHDNPDGRIAEDIRTTTEVALELGHSLLYALLLLGSFVSILWRLSGPLRLDLAGIGMDIPGHMVWVALIYSSLATALALQVGWPLIRAANRRQAAEADFRFGLVRGRENAEAIALVHGEADERRRLLLSFGGVQTAWIRQTWAMARLMMFSSGYSILSTGFPILVTAPRYIAGAITLGALMQTAQAFQQCTSALSWPVDNLQSFAQWRASVDRVLALADALDIMAGGTIRCAGCEIERVQSEGDALAFHALTIATPNGRPVVTDFSAEIHPGERVLIGGDPDAGVRLFKAVAGLWPWGGGRIELPKSARIFFMPERPYLPIGPLREALAYPSPPEAFPEPALGTALHRVGLGRLAGRLDDGESWEQVLPLGEQQLLGFARLLLHRPDWIFIEEATDALTAEGEAEMMQLLADEFPAATVLTISHHAGMEPFHHRRLSPRDRRTASRQPSRWRAKPGE